MVRVFLCVDDSDDRSSFQADYEGFDLPKVGQKRIVQNVENIFSKRQKMTESRFSTGSFMISEFSWSILIL